MERGMARLVIGAAAWLFVPAMSHAAPATLTYAYTHHLVTVSTQSQQWRTATERWMYMGQEAVPVFCQESCDDTPVPEGWTKTTVTEWNADAIRETIASRVAPVVDRDAGAVRITRNGSGDILFDGRGMTGRKTDLDRATALTILALEKNVHNVTLPVHEDQPDIVVDDPELAALGIREVVSIGESDFAGSPRNRRHNIEVGLSKFNGVLIPQGKTFSFNEILGPVNAQTGYLRELVIMGDRTVPDYGGGLCQVSSTAYRGIWEYGFPIKERRNHSYIVQYYGPQGTDATIYPPHTDLKFLNDSPGALLMQTFTDESDKAYFVYYGTRDARNAEVMGPYVWSTTEAPKETKIEYTTELAPGVRERIGSQVPGATTSWFRSVKMHTEDAPHITETYSHYQARPLFYRVGIASGDSANVGGENGEPPSWLPAID